MSESVARIEGRCAFLEGQFDSDNPYLTSGEKSGMKDEWNQKAQDWDDGWCEAKDEDDKREDLP